MKLARLLFVPLLAFLLCLPLAIGCGGSGGNASGTGTDEGEVIKEYPLKRLAPAEFETPDLEGGKLKIPTPKGWKIGDRQGGVLIRFYTEDAAGLPRLLVFSEKSPYKVETVTTENVLDLVDEIQGELDQKKQQTGKSPYREPCKPLLLGNNLWVRYVSAGTMKGHAVERVFLLTVVNKRLYKIELQVMAGKIGDFQKAAYAVAGRTVFAASPGSPAAAPEAVKPDSTKPDDAKPATDDK